MAGKREREEEIQNTCHLTYNNNNNNNHNNNNNNNQFTLPEFSVQSKFHEGTKLIQEVRNI